MPNLPRHSPRSRTSHVEKTTPPTRGRSRAAITPISAAATSASVSITCWSPAGAPTPQSRVSGAPIAPTRSSRRCSGRSRPTSKARSAFCRRSRAVSTAWGRSLAASARPAGRASSGRKTISKARTPKQLSGSSTSCSTPAGSRAARSVNFRTRPASISWIRTARCAKNCRRSRNSSTVCSHCA
jgi:hypothetical protein